MLQWILVAAALLGPELGKPTPKTGPFLEAEYRVLEAGTDRPAASLQQGGKYDLVVTVRANRREGVKINREFKSHFLRVEVVEVDEQGQRKRALPKKEYTVNPKDPRVDPSTGIGKLTVELPESIDPRALRLHLMAEVMLCDAGDTWCLQIREESMLTLPGGKVDMSPASLKYNAGKAERVVLKKGDPAPDFVATNSAGELVRLSDFRGRKNIVLVFGRGYW